MKPLGVVVLFLLCCIVFSQDEPVGADGNPAVRLPEESSKIILGDLTFCSSVENGGQGNVVFIDEENGVTILVEKSKSGFCVVSAKAGLSFRDEDGDGTPESALTEETKDGKTRYSLRSVKLELGKELKKGQ